MQLHAVGSTQDSLDAKTISETWRTTFAETPARVFLPMNESSSVGLSYEANWELNEDSEDKPTVFWSVQSTYRVETVTRFDR